MGGRTTSKAGGCVRIAGTGPGSGGAYHTGGSRSSTYNMPPIHTEDPPRVRGGSGRLDGSQQSWQLGMGYFGGLLVIGGPWVIPG